MKKKGRHKKKNSLVSCEFKNGPAHNFIFFHVWVCSFYAFFFQWHYKMISFVQFSSKRSYHVNVDVNKTGTATTTAKRATREEEKEEEGKEEEEEEEDDDEEKGIRESTGLRI